MNIYLVIVAPKSLRVVIKQKPEGYEIKKRDDSGRRGVASRSKEMSFLISFFRTFLILGIASVIKSLDEMKGH